MEGLLYPGRPCRVLLGFIYTRARPYQGGDFSKAKSRGRLIFTKKWESESEVRGSGREELPHARGQGRRLRGATPRSRSGGATMKR